LYLGGEKLKAFHRAWIRVFITFILILAVPALSPLSAQDQESAGGDQGGISSNPESSIILGEAAAPGPGASGPSSVFVMFQVILLLALVALAIYGVIFFIRRFSRPPEARDPNLKLLARLPLGNGSLAAVISVGNNAWLVGSAEGGVSLIAPIDDKEVVETMLLEEARRADAAGGNKFLDFRALLRRFGGGKTEDLSGGIGESHADNLRKQRERLKGL
jgi:flagellar protein FliO/FliZ